MRGSRTIAGQPAGRGVPAPSRPFEVDLRLVSGRGPRLSWRWPAAADEVPSRRALAGAVEAIAGRPGAILLGGDSLKRTDLLGVLDDLARLRPDRLGICTFGEGVSVDAARRLAAAGLRRVQVPLHCARQDAHDWLVGRPGALKSARRAIRAFVEAEVPVTAEVVLTRPTAPHLAETVEVLARIGVRSLCVRRLSTRDVDATAFVALSPRLELLGASLEKAAAVALERRMRMVVRDLPVCVAPRLRPLFAAPDSEIWVEVGAGEGHSHLETASGRCASCPGAPHCAGAPPDYVERFGWEEFLDAGQLASRMQEDVEEQQALRATAPMVFSWHGPRRLRCDGCADDGSGTTPEATRGIRSRLVQAARYRPQALRLVGADLLAHPAAALLIYDAVRLFPRVRVAGEASPVVDWSELDLRRIKEVEAFEVAFYGPDAALHDAHCGIPGSFAASLQAYERLRDAKIRVGAYAILHDAAALAGFVEAWGAAALPGTPSFRLSAQGGSLDELIAAARALPPGLGRDSIGAVLPRCDAGGWDDGAAAGGAGQQIIDCGRSVSYRPYGSDPVGAFESCRPGEEVCGVPDCPGLAQGWRSTARSKQWANT